MYTISKFNRSGRNMFIIQKVISIIVCIIIIPLTIFNFILVIKKYNDPNKTPNIMGFKSFVIVSESMEPTIMTGDAILVKNVQQNDLNIGDIISFNTDGIINTHRITQIIQEEDGLKYKTKGDNNKNEDLEKISFDQIEGKYILKIKKFGNIVNILKNKFTLILLLILLVIISFFQVRISKRKLLRKEKRYNYNKKTFLD